MDLNMLFEKFDLLMDSPNSTAKMRELILQLAVQGKLVEQDPNHEPAGELLKRIKAEKEKLITEGKIKKQKPLAPIDTNDAPYELPNGWVWVRNGALFGLRKGKKPKNLSEQAIGLPYLNIAALDRDEITKYTDDVKCPQATDEDILVVCDGSRSGLLLNGKSGVVGSTLAVIDSPSIIKSYLKILFAKAYQHLNSTMKGAAIPHLDTKKLLATVIGLPPEAEQKRIVAKVDELMRLCDQLDACQEKASAKYTSLNDAALEKLLSSKTIDEFAEHWQFICNNFDLIYNDPAHVNKLRQAILQLAVQGKLAPQDPNDEPAGELLKRIKAEKEKLITEGKIKKQKPLPPITEDEIPYELPQKWEWVRFNQLVNPEYPISYGVLVPGPNIEHGIPFVRIGDLNLINPPLRPEKSIDKEIDRKYERTRIVGGEILMGVVGSIGKLGIAPDSWHGANIARAICRIVPSKFIYKHYLIWLLQSELMQNGFIGDTRTLAQPTLNLGLIRVAFTPLPPLSEQHRIVSKIDQLMHLCDELETRLNQSKKDSEMLMQTVLQEALN